jgi:hypothetical protein
MDMLAAFEQIKSAFPTPVQFQGTILRQACRNGVTIVEVKRHGRYFYCLMWEGNAKIVHASAESKFTGLKTVGNSFRPSDAYQS